LIKETLPPRHAVGMSIREAAERLRYFPYSGCPGRAAGTREWVVRRFPYVLVYELDGGDAGVTILGVFHCAQKRD
jgi:plasmid stabilization system protein ParE